MAIDGFEIEKLLKNAFPTAKIKVDDLVGDKNHYSAVITAKEFKGLTRVKQHKFVFNNKELFIHLLKERWMVQMEHFMH